MPRLHAKHKTEIRYAGVVGESVNEIRLSPSDNGRQKVEWAHVRIEPGDDEEIARTLAAVADDFPWTDEASHGNARQRTAYFQKGVNGGVEGCLQM